MRPEKPIVTQASDYGLILTTEIPHLKHGSAIFAIPEYISVLSSSSIYRGGMEIATVDVVTCTDTSVYKPPMQPFLSWDALDSNDERARLVVGEPSGQRRLLWLCRCPPPETHCPRPPRTMAYMEGAKQSQVGRCRYNMVRWGLLRDNTDQCVCMTAPQTMAHLLACPACAFSCSERDLRDAEARSIDIAYWAAPL
ncbi:unnamed protein product [Chilo suppressalis]|uniref:Uncharacterized protein n=1 Tax=Chilo suppressalis TaxID=168631 RepID=A0ABN8AZN9_CHISP|nr:unnamed protein product [Chilo suppressalis]